jgi:hypothetical protein
MKTLRQREGALGGIVAGAVMAMVAMLYTLVAQGDLLAPLKQMGALFFPNEAGSAISMLAGMMLHLVTAALLGLAFVLVAKRTIASELVPSTIGFWSLAVAGMVFIVTEWLVASFLILPLLDRPLLATFASVGGFAAHLMYGIVLAGWLAWRSEPAAILVRSSREQRGAA